VFEIFLSKPVLIGMHLGFGIIGIDAFLWLLGELKYKGRNHAEGRSAFGGKAAAFVGALSFIGSWIAGGYYYVTFYGPLVRPVIKAGLAPWAHNIMMETKEHIFLFIIPLAVTTLLAVLLKEEEFESLNIRKVVMLLAAFIAALGLVIGAMGFMISAAARWGVIN